MPVKYRFPYVLDPDYKHVYTEEEQKELIKCAMDVIYFSENFYTVIDADPNSTVTEKIIELYDFQKSMLKGFQNNQFNIILSARQTGKCLEKQQTVDILDTETGEEKTIPIIDFLKMCEEET